MGQTLSYFSSQPRLPPTILVTATTSQSVLSQSAAASTQPFSIILTASTDSDKHLTIDAFQTVLISKGTALYSGGLTFRDVETGELARRPTFDICYLYGVPDKLDGHSESVVEIPPRGSERPYTVTHTFHVPDEGIAWDDGPNIVRMDSGLEARLALSALDGLQAGHTYEIGLGCRMHETTSWWTGTKRDVFKHGPRKREAMEERVRMVLVDESMPPTTALSTPLRAWRCPQCTIRYISTTAARQAVGPEHPRYIDVPQAPQQTIPDKPFPKGRLPVPRDIFRDARGLDQATKEDAAGRTHAPKQKEDRLAKPRPGSRAEWSDQISADRRRNLQEGLASLRKRRIRDTNRQALLQRLRFEQREALLNAPIREDERLTAPSHGLDLVHPPNQPYNVRLRPVQLSQEEIAERHNHKTLLAHAHAQLKTSQRLASLQELYTNARSFIVNQTQLDAAIEKEFGTDENPREFVRDDGSMSEETNENSASVWVYGRPENVQDKLNRANRQFSRTAMGGAGGYAEINAERIRKIGEALTGGKMGSAEEQRQ